MSEEKASVRPATHIALVTGELSAARLAAKLAEAAAWFMVTPMPDGLYRFEVKREATLVALVQRHLAQVER
jgi:hypothetical protein